MTDFRKRLLGICGVAVAFAGMANAQYTCGTPASASTLLRAEGTTEQTADLNITCVSPVAVVAGAANITVTVSPSLAITSIPLGAKVAGVQYTEALAVPTVGGASPAVGAPVAPVNTIQGVVAGTGNITFSGVPTPLCGGVGPAPPCAFVITITNVRVNDSTLGSGPVSVSESALVTAAGFGAVTINPSLVAATAVGITINGLAASSTANVVAGDNICTAINAAALSFNVKFGENFSTAFKNQGTSAGNAALGSWAETVNNTETGYTNGNVATSWPQSGSAAGANLANSGTRVVITVTNIPASMNVYAPLVMATVAGGGSATLVTSQTAASVGGVLNTVTPFTGTTAPNNPPIAGAGATGQLTVSGGTATAIYEMTAHAAGVTTVDNFQVPIYLAAAANTIPGTVTLGVSVQFATGAAGSAPQWVVGSSTTALTANVIGLCSTTFMWPYVTNSSGFDTGLAIANTSTDLLGLKSGAPFTSVTPQSGSCTLNFFGTNAPAAAVVTPSVAAGSTYAATVSSLAPGFTGYAIGVCQFLYAHTFAYISYNLTQTSGVSMGYLGLAVASPRVATSLAPESLGN